ncbi:MAG TPA: hypothetical protein VMU81_29060 [Acetobacteraceae bacterium]|nr:hypothetical protein [Acetobacteraceae bacterium]
MRTGRVERRRGLVQLALLVTAGAVLASCDNTPVGVSPSLQGTYWEKAVVTNPNGDGPQVVRWGPPQNFNPSGRN